MLGPPDQLRQISSRFTFFTKFISPIAGVIIGINMSLSVFRFPKGQDTTFQVIFISGLAAILALHFWIAYRIKSVTADSNNLYVSNYFKETTIALSQIDRVTGNIWLEPQLVTIHLKTPSEFGSKIAFIATYRWFGFWIEHPIVAELQQMANSATDKATPKALDL